MLNKSAKFIKVKPPYNTLFNTKFLKNSHRNFSLYIPKKKLIFHNHPKHGKVYPVYIADEEYNKKDNPKKLLPPLLLFTAFNTFLLLSGMQFIPMTSIYQSIYLNETIMITSVFANYYILNRYFKYLTNYGSRVKSLFLLPSGEKVILENFDGSVKKFEILDIFESNYRDKYHDIQTGRVKWIPMLVTNDNNIRCVIKWGTYIENYFEGKRKVMDFEIFAQIIGRTNIDTTIKKFTGGENYGIYSSEDRKKVLRYFENRKWLRKIDRNRLSYHYKLLRKKYVEGINGKGNRGEKGIKLY